MVCTYCWKYASGGKCAECGADSDLTEESSLLPTERVLLWMHNDGEKAVSAFLNHVINDSPDDSELANANWKSFREYLLNTDEMKKLPDGTKFDDPSLGDWPINEALLEKAEMLSYIDD